MSWIWSVMLSFSDEELWEDGEDAPRRTCRPMERINAWIPHGRLVDLVSPTYKDDVGSGIAANLFGGGYNHLDMDAFIEVVESQDWKDRANLQLWIKGDEDQSWTPVRLRRRRRSTVARG